MLSVRSPTMDSAATATQVKTKGQTSTDNHQVAAAHATMALAHTPPSAPSHVFLGDTRGASGTRPNHRPAKNAPVSAAHTSASVNSTQCVLCVVNVTYTRREPARHQRQQSRQRCGDRCHARRRQADPQERHEPPHHGDRQRDPHEARRRGIQVEARDQRQRNDNREHRTISGAREPGEACPLPRADQHQHGEQTDGGNRRQAEHDAEHHGDQHERGEYAFFKHAAWPRAPARGSGRNVARGRRKRRSRHRDARTSKSGHSTSQTYSSV